MQISNNSLLHLSDELIRKISSFLDEPTWLSLRQTSQRMRDLTDDAVQDRVAADAFLRLPRLYHTVRSNRLKNNITTAFYACSSNPYLLADPRTPSSVREHRALIKTSFIAALRLENQDYSCELISRHESLQLDPETFLLNRLYGIDREETDPHQCDVSKIIPAESELWSYPSFALLCLTEKDKRRRTIQEEFRLFAEHIRDSTPIARCVVRRNCQCFTDVSVRLKDDDEIAYEAIRQSGDLLQHASARIKDTAHMVLTALDTSEDALVHASERLKDHDPFIEAARRKSSHVFLYASERIQCKHNQAVLQEGLERLELKEKECCSIV